MILAIACAMSDKNVILASDPINEDRSLMILYRDLNMSCGAVKIILKDEINMA